MTLVAVSYTHLDVYKRQAANSASAVLPEQAGIWTYPLKDADRESCIMNMASAMLQRIHLGGNLDQLTEESFALIKEGIQCYKEIRKMCIRDRPDPGSYYYYCHSSDCAVFEQQDQKQSQSVKCNRQPDNPAA